MIVGQCGDDEEIGTMHRAKPPPCELHVARRPSNLVRTPAPPQATNSNISTFNSDKEGGVAVKLNSSLAKRVIINLLQSETSNSLGRGKSPGLDSIHHTHSAL
jgi:hypothetical protein